VFTLNRRDALGWLGVAACATVSPAASAGEPASPRKKPRWKTAIGRNGFQSASAKYGKAFPIMIDAWEAPDPYEANTKGKEAIDRALAQA
jgi:hypothetical protein